MGLEGREGPDPPAKGPEVLVNLLSLHPRDPVEQLVELTGRPCALPAPKPGKDQNIEAQT